MLWLKHQPLSIKTTSKTLPSVKSPQQLKILNINFQSVVNKVPEFHCLVDTEKPDVIIGTESWLSPDIKDNEIFSTDGTPFRADRQTTTKRSDGVFVLVKNSLVCTEQPQFRMDCQIIWIKLEIVGAQPLYVAAFYKPKKDDLDSIEQLRNSLDMLTNKKSTIISWF